MKTGSKNFAHILQKEILEINKQLDQIIKQEQQQINRQQYKCNILDL